MNCEQARTEIVAYLKGELSADQEQKLKEHLAGCPACRKDLDNARKLLTWTEAASEKATAHALKQVIIQAIEDGASDVHFEPQSDNSVRVRYRIDGVLHDAMEIAPAHKQGIIARLKMISEMNVADTSLPQDGRFDLEVDDRHYDLRVSAVPYIFGEGLVVRILSGPDWVPQLSSIYMYDDQLEAVRKMLQQPMGMIVVAGPTGSGKTTTAYSMLTEINRPEIKILTIEDPVEYKIKGINQCHVRKAAGFTFANALRSFLRQDPDVVFSGEIKDAESAEILAATAITGHLVITTLAPQDAPSVIRRLIDVGIEQYLVGAMLLGVVGQRLVRRVCSFCKEEIQVDLNDPVIRFLGINAEDLNNHKIYRGVGCEKCRHLGYKGRAGIYEVLAIDKELATKIGEGASTEEIKQSAIQKGFLTMVDDGKRKVLDGMTTPEEVFRVLV